jgi:bacterioferritin
LPHDNKFYNAAKQVIIGEIMSDELLDLLNKAIEKEIGAGMQYVWQQLIVESPDIKGIFRDNAIDKLKQAMKIGERIFNLGEIPNAPVTIGKSLREMIELDLKAENEVIKIYQEIFDLAAKEEDTATRSLCEKILAEEQERKRILMCERGRALTKLMK